MNEQRRFGESDHEPLNEDDILKQAIAGWREEMPARDLWSGIQSRLATQAQPVVVKQRFFTVTITQMAVAASMLIAVTAAATWFVAHPPAVSSKEAVIQAYGLPEDDNGGAIQPANFADAQYNAAVSDLERILIEERDRLDPRTVVIIERNLKAIDAAINEARMALNDDPANPYLNSHLADARRRKLDLLRHATSLASAGGD